MQDYEAFVDYFTEAEWDALQQSDASPNEIRHIIFERVLDLGGDAHPRGPNA